MARNTNLEEKRQQLNARRIRRRQYAQCMAAGLLGYKHMGSFLYSADERKNLIDLSWQMADMMMDVEDNLIANEDAELEAELEQESQP